MFLRVSIAVFLLSLSVCGVLGASVSVNVTDTKMTAENATNIDNSTKSLNASGNVLKIRAVDFQLQSLNTSDDKSLNSTLNSTSSSMEEREIDDVELLLLLDEDDNSTQAGNSSESVKSENVKVERATVEVTGNETLRLNATEGQAANNQTTRQVSVNATSDVKAMENSTTVLNGSEASQKVRDVEVQLKDLAANVSDAALSANSTVNATSDLPPQKKASLFVERQVEGEVLLSEATNSTKTTNSTNSGKSDETKAERAVVVIIT